MIACSLRRATIIDALSPLGTLGSGVAGGEGAIYLWARLPEGGKPHVSLSSCKSIADAECLSDLCCSREAALQLL